MERLGGNEELFPRCYERRWPRSLCEVTKRRKERQGRADDERSDKEPIDKRRDDYFALCRFCGVIAVHVGLAGEDDLLR